MVIKMKSGEEFVCEKDGYKGYYTDPLSWEEVIDKFKRLTRYKTSNAEQIIQAITELEKINVNDLLNCLFQPE